MSKSRNRIVHNGWTLEKLTDYSVTEQFMCGDHDLDEYFKKDVIAHKEQLLTKTYAFYDDPDFEYPMALVDLCNDCVRREKLTKFSIIPEEKRYPDYPAVKITRLGVASHLHGLGTGSYLIITLKQLFITDNRTGCRFITVDAYNNQRTLNFYLKNGFMFFNDKDVNKNTRSMFFDLLTLK